MRPSVGRTAWLRGHGILAAALVGTVLGVVYLLMSDPARGAERDPTPSQIEGPYYKSNSPLRTSLLEEGMLGTRLVLKGRVFSSDGSPIKGARLDFWQADANGAYDNRGYRLRGHQFTDEQGRYSLETIVPGNYAGRTSHIHVKVQGPGQPILTTQLFFPDDPRNRADWLYKPGLLLQVKDTARGKEAAFDFVLGIR